MAVICLRYQISYESFMGHYQSYLLIERSPIYIFNINCVYLRSNAGEEFILLICLKIASSLGHYAHIPDSLPIFLKSHI
jgi:hypothetical protein